MDHQKLFQTVCSHHRTKPSCSLHHNHNNNHYLSNRTSPGLTPDLFQSSPITHSTGPIAPCTPSSSSTVPRGLSSSNNYEASSSSTVAATPSSTSSSTTLAVHPSTSSNTEHLSSHSTLSSSPVSFDSNISHHGNGILFADDIAYHNGVANNHNNHYYVPITSNSSNHPFILQGLSSEPSQYAAIYNGNHNLDVTFATAAAAPAVINATATNNNNMRPPTGININDGDLDNASFYCIDRGNGQYTPLIALDQLPADFLGYLPARVTSHENMIVLPPPRLAGTHADNQALAKFADLSVTPPSSPNGGGHSTDLIQSRIDDIIAQAPNPENDNNAVVVSRNNNKNGNNGGPKREKIYCDKWIHDGTCAFTQQGCKFKHEMPGDKEGQHSLGLFHGYPGWWKQMCAEENIGLDDRAVFPPGYGMGTPVGHRRIMGRLGGGAGGSNCSSTAVTTIGGAHGHGHGHGHGYGNGNGNGTYHNNNQADGFGGGNGSGGSGPSSAFASNNWRQRPENMMSSPQSPPEHYSGPPSLSGGSDRSVGHPRNPWQPRSRAVGSGNVQQQPHGNGFGRFSMPHLAQQPNFGPIAPPSQDNNTGGFARRRRNNNSNRGGHARENNRSEDTNSSQARSTDEMGNASGVRL